MKRITKEEYLHTVKMAISHGIESPVKLIPFQRNRPISIEPCLKFGDNVYIKVRMEKHTPSIVGIVSDSGEVRDEFGTLIGDLCEVLDLPIDLEDCDTLRGAFYETGLTVNGITYNMRFYDGLAIGVEEKTNAPVYITYPTKDMVTRNKLLQNQLKVNYPNQPFEELGETQFALTFGSGIIKVV